MVVVVVVVTMMVMMMMMMVVVICSVLVESHYIFCTLSLRKNVQMKLNRTSGTSTHRANLHRTTINKLQPIELICYSNPAS